MQSTDDNPRKHGSLTLTVRKGAELEIAIPGGERIVVYCGDARGGRATLNIRAPLDYKITRA